MASLRMVPLLTTPSAFQARVLAARLGSEGIVVSLRGAVDGPYPFGDVYVDVDADGLELARNLLLADEVESAFANRGGEGRRPGRMPAWLAIAAVIFVTVASSLVRLVSL